MVQIKIRYDKSGLIQFRMYISKIEFLFPIDGLEYVYTGAMIRLKPGLNYRFIIKTAIKMKILESEIGEQWRLFKFLQISSENPS